MTSQENKITPGQLFVLLVQTEIGVSILSLPNSIFSKGRTDGWISMLLAGVITQILIFLIWHLNSRFGELTIFSICKKLLGKWFGTFVAAAYFCYFAATASLTLILFARMISIWVLPRTPLWVIMLLMVATGVHLVRENLRILARFYTFVFIFIGIYLILIAYSFKDAHILYLLPIGHYGFFNILNGSEKATLSVLGFEMLLVVYPYVQGSPKQKLKAATYANVFVTLLYTLTIVCVYLFFSPAQIPLLPQPVLYMFKSFTFTIIERVDLLFLSIWVVIVATSYTSYLYMASNGMANLLKKKNHSSFVPIVSLLVLIVALLPDQNELLITKINHVFEQISIPFIFALPLFLWLLSFVRGKKERRANT